MPVLYYIRHGETDFNVEARLQGRRDTVLNARGRQQAAECGELLRDLFARERRDAADFAYVASPLAACARHHGSLARHPWSGSP